MKKQIKIDFRYFWPGFNKTDNFFYNFLKKHYSVIIEEENPDYVFFSVFGEGMQNHAKASGKIKSFSPKLHDFLKNSIFWEKLKSSLFWKKKSQKKIPELKGNFVKIFYTPEYINPDLNKCDWAFGFNLEENLKSKKYFRLPYYVFEGFGKNLIKFKEKSKKKKYFCNFIYSNEVGFRNKFFKELSKYKFVHSPGKCMNNSPAIKSSSPENSRSKSTWQKDKISYLKNFKFTIAFENLIEDGYTTEKITQPMIAGSIPIYFGNPKIGEEFNKKSFICVNDFKNFKEVIKKIREIDGNKDLYEKMLKEPWLIKNKENKYMDEKRILKRFKEIFG
jgi:alpha(1,3/1,4) fucosyltransferase